MDVRIGRRRGSVAQREKEKEGRRDKEERRESRAERERRRGEKGQGRRLEGGHVVESQVQLLAEGLALQFLSVHLVWRGRSPGQRVGQRGEGRVEQPQRPRQEGGRKNINMERSEKNSNRNESSKLGLYMCHSRCPCQHPHFTVSIPSQAVKILALC